MRKILSIILIVVLIMENIVNAQNIVIKKYSKNHYGLYDKSTKSWSSILFKEYKPQLEYNGHIFFIVKGTNDCWGVVDNENYGEWFVKNEYLNVSPWPSDAAFIKVGCFDIQVGNKHGLLDGKGRVLLPVKYSFICSAFSYQDKQFCAVLDRDNCDSVIYCADERGELLYVLHYFPGIIKPDSNDWYVVYPRIPRDSQVIDSTKDKNKRKKNNNKYSRNVANEYPYYPNGNSSQKYDQNHYYWITMDKLAINADMKEEIQRKKELLDSFPKYAQDYVQPRMIEWQKKGEFEKLADYQRRVSGERRQNKIDELTCEAERQFLDENSKLINLRKSITLGVYDSENEVFALQSSLFGLLLIKVPFQEGPFFQKYFPNAYIANEKYFVKEDKFSLASFDIIVNGKSYHYSNNNALNYSQYQLNPDDLDLPAINIVTGNSNTTMRKPKVMVVSPQTGSQYQQNPVIFCINIIPGDGLHPTLYVEINGADKMELQPVDQQSKGARITEGRQYELNLPTEPGRIVNVAFTAVDEQNISSETQKVKLTYTGQVMKPKLFLFAVGVSDYTSGDLKKLDYAAKDARDLVSTIENANLEDYTELVKYVYVDQEATRKNIAGGLHSLQKEISQGDVVMFFFSGHGVKDGNEAYFMTINASSENPDEEAVSFSSLKNCMSKLVDRQVKVVSFMDACHAGAMVNAKGAVPKLTELNIDKVVEFYSCASGEESAEDSKLNNGVFTSALIKGIDGAAANADGFITIRTLSKYILDYVGKYNKNQNPILPDRNGEDFILFRTK